MSPALFLSLALQVTPTAGLPPAGPTTPATNEAAIVATINAVFAALEAGDGTGLLKHVDAEGRITGVGRRPDGTAGPRRRNFTEYAARMKIGQGFVERITDPTIKIDADIAMVWAPFTIVADGKVTSCGFDHFDMVREDGVWKVANLTFSSRTDCTAPPE